jgi:hypothetical protein
LLINRFEQLRQFSSFTAVVSSLAFLRLLDAYTPFCTGEAEAVMHVVMSAKYAIADWEFNSSPSISILVT